jgi:hypothetical protein
MAASKLRQVIRESVGNIWREAKIACTKEPSPEKWVFLVGCYNSGTTLLSELLGKHPSISALPTEGHFITDQFPKDYEVGLPRMWVGNEKLFCLTESDEGPDPERIKREWAMRLDLSKPVLLEKSPPNSARTRWLQKNFENAYFISIVRNGYAVAEGISRKGDPQHLGRDWSIEESIWQWKRGNEILFNDAKYLKNYHQIKYEDLASDPYVILNGIAGFLGIESFDGFDQGQSFKIHEREDSVRDLNQVSIDRLTREQVDKVNDIAGEMLSELGYEVL